MFSPEMAQGRIALHTHNTTAFPIKVAVRRRSRCRDAASLPASSSPSPIRSGQKNKDRGPFLVFSRPPTTHTQTPYVEEKVGPLEHIEASGEVRPMYISCTMLDFIFAVFFFN